ncbi:LamB/YcsF family protein [Actinomadura madurae]|uniref:LamB/YcsF family protein n=1 Tax=Actinomadura madurae TaxID=1993 RepID=UPI002026D935|nr:5-oxoprolinase subunit PxpA [Actinomadura madurae]MCP9955671.1 5-oxoprolinase subunit PxpA [Actinomadura madurae]MCP9984917.1 5-oxoprolinase subunit PxpA [Actinomadura madurae]MCQ0003531.1 5-oxoprolinase subunit PxpA [Actinomadura madurae]MCQ0021108.1 5-oxoprolinase subunit PxpA [Actinomadura madurae]URN01119.1 5-oxoprolinase subunit PxpA [Actinomadura madurae]
MTAHRIDVNADAGESYGRWRLGEDARLFQYVSSTNIACGFHAGDPTTMHAAVRAARDAGVAVGAHPGYPDKLGFGRRAMAVSIEETTDYVVYQVGSLAAIAATEGVRLRHLKPHGALMGAVCRNPDLATAVAAAVHRAGLDLPLMLAPSPALDAVEAAGHPVIPENAVDLGFDDDGLNIIEPRPAARDPDRVAQVALAAAAGHAVTTTGRTIPMPVRSICVHGDRPNAVDIAAAVHRRLTEAGIAVQPATADASAR